jgi:uncharacterized membrane protein
VRGSLARVATIRPFVLAALHAATERIDQADNPKTTADTADRQDPQDKNREKQAVEEKLQRKPVTSTGSVVVGRGRKTVHSAKRPMTSIAKPSRAQRVYRLTLLSWIALVLIHLGIYLAAFFRAGPTDEVYANSISFQILAFCITALPYWLLVLLVVLIVEFATVGRAPRTRS